VLHVCVSYTALVQGWVDGCGVALCVCSAAAAGMLQLVCVYIVAVLSSPGFVCVGHGLLLALYEAVFERRQ